MAKVEFFNTYQRKQSSWDPEVEGSYVYAFKPGCDGKYAENREIGLANGAVSGPYRSLSGAVSGYVEAISEYPQIDGRLAIYKVPIIFSNRESWIEIEFIVPDEMAADAKKLWSGWKPSWNRIEDYRNKWNNRDAEVRSSK